MSSVGRKENLRVVTFGAQAALRGAITPVSQADSGGCLMRRFARETASAVRG